MEARGPDGKPLFLAYQPARVVVSQLRRAGRVMGMTKGQFSLGDLIGACLEVTGPASVSISTWTAGIRDGRAMSWMLERGNITSLRLLVDRSFATRQPRYCAAVRQMFGDTAIRATKTHAKVVTIAGGGWHLAIRSSMNLNRNPRYETFDIDDDEAIWAFFEGHFDEMEEEMPPGPVVASADVDAVFERARGGADPFTAIDRDWIEAEGCPLAATPPEFCAWVTEQLRANRRAKVKPDGWPGLARAMRLPTAECRRCARGPTDEAWRLSAALEVLRGRE